MNADAVARGVDERADEPILRRAIDQRLLVRLAYQRKDGTASERIVWPLGLLFWGAWP